MNVHEQLGENIKQFRLQRDMTIEALASEAGVAFTTLSLTERGKNNPSLDLLIKISSALDVPMTALFEDHTEGKQDKKKPAQPFRHKERIDQLPLHERKLINGIVGNMLSLIEAAAERGCNDDIYSDMR